MPKRDGLASSLAQAHRTDRQTLLVSVARHVDWWSATREERNALIDLLDECWRDAEAAIAGAGHNGVVEVTLASEGARTARHAHFVLRVSSNEVLEKLHLPRFVHRLGAQQHAPHSRALVRGAGSILGQEDDPLLPHLLAAITTATTVDIAVAFALSSGVAEIEEHLRDVIARGGRVRILAGDYLGITEPDALLRLLDLGPELELFMFESKGTSFHLKSYICLDAAGTGTAFVGSSNLSATALRKGVEWNWRVVTSFDTAGFAEVQSAFGTLIDDTRNARVDAEWISKYRTRRPIRPLPEFVLPPEAPLEIPRPHGVQQEALQALASAREKGAVAGLVVLATGLGKTWLAAFDTQTAGAGRVLFVAHRDEILDQAARTFRAIRPSASLGKYTGTEKSPDADIVLASVQTLSSARHLQRFNPRDFSYIVVDEFHHASASTYRRLLNHFEADFLLGLTATPERSDGADLLALCGENLVYRCDLADGIRRGLLAPFDYFGVPDDVDYENIPWRNGKFDIDELTTRLTVESRAENALMQLRTYGGRKALAFCASQRHADFMCDHFTTGGVKCAAVHSGPSSAPRADSIQRLKDGDLEVLFCVDIFNEGVDLPDVDTILMLRPTESSVLFLQQLGRGLRILPGKKLRVVDYIGNHRSFLVKPLTLFQFAASAYGDLAAAFSLSDAELASKFLAPGCSVTYDLVARQFIRDLLQTRIVSADRLETYYRDFRERNGSRPSASEAFHDGYNPRAARSAYGSWFQFVAAMGDLQPSEADAEVASRDLLSSLEAMPVTSAIRILVIVALASEGQFPGSIGASDLLARIRSIARRYAMLRSELSLELEDDSRLLDAIGRDALPWVRESDSRPYLVFESTRLATSNAIPAANAEELRALTAELAEWRLAQYVARGGRDFGADRIVCRVSHSSDSPILFLPPRDETRGIPEGWVDIAADGRQFQAKFAKIAVNVVHPSGSEENVLGDLLRGWYGPEAGMPGTTHRAVFERASHGYTLAPYVPGEVETLELWSAHARQDCARLLGVTLGGFESQSGIVVRDGMLLLFVTLDKTGQPENQKYLDKFLDASTFQWQSQNKTKKNDRTGRMISQSDGQRAAVHLFVRDVAKVRGKTQSFVYCGRLQFVEWGEKEISKPITVVWKLPVAVPESLQSTLRVPKTSG